MTTHIQLFIEIQEQMDMLQNVLRTSLETIRQSGQPDKISLDLLAADICKAFALSPVLLYDKKRLPKYIAARSVLSYIARKKGCTLPQIATYLDRNHATIIWYLNEIQNRYQNYPEYRQQFDEVFLKYNITIQN